MWGGQPYVPLPMEASGFEMTTRGAFPQPNITISNLYGAGNLLLDSYRGLVGADLVRILTLRRFLDDGASPDPNAYITRDKFVVAQKTSHNAVAIVFKLATRMDQEGTQLPRRQILRDVCTHVYRVWDPATLAFDYSRVSCPYTGPAPGTRPTRRPMRRTISARARWPAARCASAAGVLPARFFPGVGKVK